MRTIVSLLVLWGFMLSAACQANSAEASQPLAVTPSLVAEPFSTPVPVSPSPGDILMTPSTSIPSDIALQDLIEKAKEDLARRLSISVDEIRVEEAKSVIWPNASLGCPQKGMVYADVLTPGYLILLNANNIKYEYHASRGTELIYCVNPSPPVPGTPGNIPGDT